MTVTKSDIHNQLLFIVLYTGQDFFVSCDLLALIQTERRTETFLSHLGLHRPPSWWYKTSAFRPKRERERLQC